MTLRTSDESSVALDERTRRARTEPMSVTAMGGGTHRVVTDSGDYVVDLTGGRCTCPDHRYRGGWCKHLRRVAAEVNAGTVPPPGKSPVECSVCGREFLADEPVDDRPRCKRCDFDVGQFVVDDNTGDLLVVAGAPGGRADETTVPDRNVTVADYPGNERYPDDDPVVRVMYPLPPGLESGEVRPHHLRQYRFPASRLRPAGDADDERADDADERTRMRQFA
ncbi:hypothetical protein BRC81_07670 [Halobacteriales archaeon QS_1_68_20]|nr:MAG: hypothetical protein BRC81_07670 [Halobacteriales archaeon QS_1_68_20]